MSKKLSALLAGLVVLSVSANAAELNAYTIMPKNTLPKSLHNSPRIRALKSTSFASPLVRHWQD